MENDWRNYNQIWDGIKANTRQLEITTLQNKEISLLPHQQKLIFYFGH